MRFQFMTCVQVDHWILNLHHSNGELLRVLTNVIEGGDTSDFVPHRKVGARIEIVQEEYNLAVMVGKVVVRQDSLSFRHCQIHGEGVVLW